MKRINLAYASKVSLLVIFLIAVGILIGFFIFKTPSNLYKAKFLEEVPNNEYTQTGQAIKAFNEMFYRANSAIPVPQKYISLSFSMPQLATMETAFSMDTDPHGPTGDKKFHGFRIYPMMYSAAQEPDITKRFHVLLVPEYQKIDAKEHVIESFFTKNTSNKFGLYNHMDPSPPGPSNEKELLITLLNAQ